MFKNRAFVALFIFFLILVVGYFGTSAVSSFTGEFYLNNPLFHVLFAFILILITVLFAFFIRNLVLFFFPHFKTNLRMKIFTAFLLLILGPALFTIFISSSVVNKGLDRLLRIQVKRIVNLSEDTTNEFQNFIADDIKRKIAQLRWKKKIYPYTLKVYGIDGFLRKKGDKIERIGDIPLKVLDLKNIYHLKEFSYLDTSTGYFIVCENKKGLLVCISKKFPPELVENVKKIKDLYSNYESLVAYRSPIKALYTFTFALMGLAVLFGALWFARYFEKRITIPIEALYRATQKLSKGELDVKVEEQASDELKHVIDAFNYMVEQLKALRISLEESRKYVEQILNSISPAIVTFDIDGKVISCNESARKLFGFSEENKGENVWKLLESYPQLKKAVKELILTGNRKTEVREEINGKEKFFSVEIIVPAGVSDRILIVEDVTDLVKAQKAQTWKEIAQRIAHEIKNPLTPITLNAERIRRQFKKKNPEIEKVIEKAVSSILAEVEVIERLIDEFRKFARLPLPEKELTDLNALIKSVADGYKEKLEVELNFEDIPQLSLDRVLMREVFANLFRNSMEAGAKKISVTTTEKDGKVYVVIRDDGPGIPEELMDKLFSPYVSTKEKGWGLGLSIVKKIIEDHGGKIYTIDKNTFVIELPV